MSEPIGLDLVGLVRAAVAANVDRAGREAGGRDGAHLMAPRVPRLRKAVDQDNQRAPTLERDPQRDLAHLYLTKIGHDGSSLDRRDPTAARSCRGRYAAVES